jgi:hypothetical protein
MMVLCLYSKMVWRGLQNWIGTTLHTPPTNNYRKLKTWWNNMMDTQDRAQKVIYTTWNIWKERCRRVFDNKAMTESQLQNVIKNDVDQWRIAWRHIDSDQPAQ